MPRRLWLKLCRSGGRFCADGACSLLLWTLWLGLALSLATQLFIVGVRELPVPSPVLRHLEQRFTNAGWHATFGAATFDPAGHVLIRDLRLSLRSLPEPVLTVQTAFFHVEPWALLVGDVRLRSAGISGGNLLVPALLSPSGRSEPLLRDVDARVQPGRGARGMLIEHFTARAGAIALQAHGSMAAPAHPKVPLEDRLEQVAEAYPRVSRDLASRLARLPAMDDARLSLQFEAAADRTGLVEAILHLGSVTAEPALTGRPEPVTLQGLRLRLESPLPWAGIIPGRVIGDLTCAQVDAGESGRTDRVQARGIVRMEAGGVPLRPAGGRVEFSAATLSQRGLTVASPVGTLASTGWPRVRAEAAGLVFGEPGHLRLDLDALTRAGEVAVEGAVAPAWIAWIGERLDRDLPSLLAWDEPPWVRGRITLGPGGQPSAATAAFATGALTARGVALDATAARLRWSGTSLEAEDILLSTGMSEARGRYVMDTETLDFRFLLEGRLQPAAINGWFGPWWPRFWSSFAFASALPADVEVRGRWREPGRTAVFVAADGAPVVLRGADFDRVRARLFARPGFTDVLEFIGERGGRVARGTFIHTADLAAREWVNVAFDVRGDTDLAPAEEIFGPTGASIVAPFTFAKPPRLHVRGELAGPAAPGGRRSDVRVDGEAAGDWAFHDFPLHGLKFRAHLQDDVLLVEDLAAGFAGGIGSGRVELRGLATERRLAFDLALDDAGLGEGIHRLEAWSALRRGEPRPPVSRFQQQVAPGRLHLDLSAEGRYDDPYSLRGAGNAVITGADLAEINILGLLSTLLRRTIFNFTTLQLHTARGSFALLGDTLQFDQLRLNGPRAAVEAKGGYRLDTKRLDFAAKVLPFDSSGNLLETTVGAVLTPLSNVLEVRLEGRIDQPRWAFVYGPTSLLRALTGDGRTDAEAPPPER